MTLVGLISDTHGLLRREAVHALAGADHILHAGDIGLPKILDELRAIAPVTVVRGNVDTEAWWSHLPDDTVVSIEGFKIYMIHALQQMTIFPKEKNISVVVCGHSHSPLIETMDDVIYVNPGSAGPRRFTLPVSVGFLRLTRGAPIEAWLKPLDT